MLPKLNRNGSWKYKNRGFFLSFSPFFFKEKKRECTVLTLYFLKKLHGVTLAGLKLRATGALNDKM